MKGFPLLLDWYVVHRRSKRLPPVATAFRSFLVDEGAELLERITHFAREPGTRRRGAKKRRAARAQ